MAQRIARNGVVVRHALFEKEPGFHACICGGFQYRVFGNDNKLSERFNRHAGAETVTTGLSGKA